MNILCYVFGHKAPQYAHNKGWGGYEYCHLSTPYIDNIKRQHVIITGLCARCEKRFTVGQAHLPPNRITK